MVVNAWFPILFATDYATQHSKWLLAAKVLVVGVGPLSNNVVEEVRFFGNGSLSLSKSMIWKAV